MGRRKGSATRCGYCYSEGHNRVTCPSLKKEIANDPEGPAARRAMRKKSRQKKRTCSYCQQPGHNQTTCSIKKCDATEYAHLNWKYQNAMSAIFRKAGFGVGSIVMLPKYDAKLYYLVIGLNLDHINLANAYSRGLGNDTDSNVYSPVKLQRIDIQNIHESDRGRAWHINPAVSVPKFAHDEIFGAEENKYDNSSTTLEVVGPVEIGSAKMGFNRQAGCGFLNNKEFGGDYASRTIKRIKDKIKTSQIR